MKFKLLRMTACISLFVLGGRPLLNATEGKNFFSLEANLGRHLESGKIDDARGNRDAIIRNSSGSDVSYDEDKGASYGLFLNYERAMLRRHHLGFRFGYDRIGMGKYQIISPSFLFLLDEESLIVRGHSLQLAMYYRLAPKAIGGFSPYIGFGANRMKADAIVKIEKTTFLLLLPSTTVDEAKFESETQWIPLIMTGIDWYHKDWSIGLIGQYLFGPPVDQFRSNGNELFVSDGRIYVAPTGSPSDRSFRVDFTGFNLLFGIKYHFGRVKGIIKRTQAI